MKSKKGVKSQIFECCYAFLGFLLRIKNFNKRKILIYTDSRGFDVLSKYGKNPFNSYCKNLINNYNTRFYICEEKHTTILDFLIKIKSIDVKKFDAIILHCGVVDFSPRPISNLKWVLETKWENHYFQNALKNYGEYYCRPHEIIYNGEKTLNLYSKEFLNEIVIDELKNIDNLLWISSNEFISGWNGNYDKGRPLNINDLVKEFDNILCSKLKNVIDLRTWSENEVKKFTIDNIHFTKDGFLEVFRLVDEKLIEIL